MTAGAHPDRVAASRGEAVGTTFLDLCERAADYARREAHLRERRAQASLEGASLRPIDEELEAVVIEKRIALLRALDWQAPSRADP